MDIPDWRRKIDAIDKQLLQLLNERASYALKIGEIKKEKNLPIQSTDREDEIMRYLLDSNPGPLDNGQILAIFKSVIDESRHLQQKNSK